MRRALRNLVRTLGLALALAVALGPTAARAECRATVEVSPEHPYVGQAIHYIATVQLGSGSDGLRWIQEPRFPSLRSERIASAADDRGRREERRLFALDAGRHELPALRGECTQPERGSAQPFAFEVPARSIDVRALPDSPAAPPAFEGLVARHVSLHWQGTPRALQLGESLQLELEVRSDGDLSRPSRPTLRAATLSPATKAAAAVDVFDDADARAKGPERARRFRWLLVPRTAGRLVVEAVALVYFDPEKASYRTVRSAAYESDVRERGLKPERR